MAQKNLPLANLEIADIAESIELRWHHLGDKKLSKSLAQLHLTGDNYDNLSIAKFIEIVKDLPQLTHLNFTNNALGKKPYDKLIPIFQALPQSLTHLNLKTNKLARGKTAQQLISIFKVLPQNLTHLNLSKNSFSHYTAEELISIFKTLPPKLTHLDLSKNDLSNYTAEELISIFKALPPKLSHLNLLNNNFNGITHLSLDEVLGMYQALATKFTQIDLNFSDYGMTLVQLIKALLPDLASTDLSHDRSDINAEALKVFHALPSDFNKLNLNDNLFQLLTVERIIRIFKALPKDFHHLNIEANSLNYKTMEELISIFKALPPTIAHLNLGRNDFSLKTNDELIHFFKVLPQSLTSLNLHTCNLSKKTTEELRIIFQALPQSITHLDLSANKLGTLTDKELTKLLAALPSNIQTVSIDGRVFFQDRLFAEQLLNQVSALSQQKPRDRLALQNIYLEDEIDEKRLNRIIPILEKINSPAALLTCGLLLNGEIKKTPVPAYNLEQAKQKLLATRKNKETKIIASNLIHSSEERVEMTSNPEDQNSLEAFWSSREKRTHDTISFYTRAAKTSEAGVKSMAEFLLWELKITCELTSVQERLAEYDVSPQSIISGEIYSQPSAMKLGLFSHPGSQQLPDKERGKNLSL